MNEDDAACPLQRKLDDIQLASIELTQRVTYVRGTITAAGNVAVLDV